MSTGSFEHEMEIASNWSFALATGRFHKLASPPRGGCSMISLPAVRASNGLAM